LDSPGRVTACNGIPSIAAWFAVPATDDGVTQNKHIGNEFVNHHLYYPQLSVTSRPRLCLRAKISVWNQWKC